MSLPPPKLNYVNSFVLYGHSVVTSNNNEANPTTSKLPTLWQQFISRREQEVPVFCVYWNYESDADGLYQATVGSTVDKTQGPSDSVRIKEGYYLVFKNRGPKPAAIIEIWQYIWCYFENTSNSNYKRTFITDFEQYNADDAVTVYIGIQKHG
ncbi:MAG: hypothetical protein BGO90_06870 [Legionella sp. 40-6]|nr:effector binding domain-containing protein [Legionella sp.]OJY06309.1 MAG: hypothetical protein BGO90_06870 [Legionella sp. 40-6]